MAFEFDGCHRDNSFCSSALRHIGDCGAIPAWNRQDEPWRSKEPEAFSLASRVDSGAPARQPVRPSTGKRSDVYLGPERKCKRILGAAYFFYDD